MNDWPSVYDLRERTAAALEAAVAGELDPEVAEQLLADLRASWSRETRWRNVAPPTAVQHEAGPVIDSREYRRSCPGYIVDRRQACRRCGAQLVRGRWAMFFTEGTKVGVLGTVVYEATGDPREVPCTD